jgi:hypothetical protein
MFPIHRNRLMGFAAVAMEPERRDWMQDLNYLNCSAGENR